MKTVKLFVIGLICGIVFLSSARDINTALFDIENELDDIKDKILSLSERLDEKEFTIKNSSSQEIIVGFFYQFEYRLTPGKCISLKRKHFFQGLSLIGEETRSKYGFCHSLKKIPFRLDIYENLSCYPDNYEFVGTDDEIIMVPSDPEKSSCESMDSLIEEAKERFLESVNKD